MTCVASPGGKASIKVLLVMQMKKGGCEQKHSQSIFATKILCFVEFIYTITLLSSRVEKKRNISLYKMMKFIYVHDVTLVNIKLLTIYLGRKIVL